MKCRNSTLASLLVTSVFIGGCGQNGDVSRVVVSGLVTYQGNAIQDGQIRFCPLADTRGSVSIATIRDGQYCYDHLGGVPLGNHRIEIFSFDPKSPASLPGHPPRRQLLPSKYNQQSALTVSIAAESGHIVKDFPLTD